MAGMLLVSVLAAIGCGAEGDRPPRSAGSRETAKFPPGALVPATRPGRPGTGPNFRTYVGQAQDTDIFIGMYVDDRTVLAYACDGIPKTRPWTVREWIAGPLRGRRFDLVSGDGSQTSKGDVRLTGIRQDGAVRGVLTLSDGKRLRYTARLAGPNAGLIRVEKESAQGERVADGWIQLPDGRVRGVISNCACSADHDKWCKSSKGYWYKACDNCC